MLVNPTPVVDSSFLAPRAVVLSGVLSPLDVKAPNELFTLEAESDFGPRERFAFSKNGAPVSGFCKLAQPNAKVPLWDELTELLNKEFAPKLKTLSTVEAEVAGTPKVNLGAAVVAAAIDEKLNVELPGSVPPNIDCFEDENEEFGVNSEKDLFDSALPSFSVAHAGHSSTSFLFVM